MVALGCLATVVLVVGAAVVGYFNWRYGQLKRVNVRLTPIATGGPVNFLIAGSDTRAGITRKSANAGAFLNGPDAASEGKGLSDSIMILRIDPRSTQAQLLSIPRDLWVPIAGHTYSAKINSAFDARNPQVLIDTIEQDLHIPISHYVNVDFAGFQRLVDAIGGVPIYFDVPMRDTNTGLDVAEPGCVVLGGEQALAFARSRHLQFKEDGRWHSDNANDYGRQVRQQFLVRKTIQKVEHEGVITKPAELNAVIDALVRSVTVDGTVGVSDLVSLARRFESFDASSLQSYELPTDRYFSRDGQDALKLVNDQAQPILAAFGGSAQGSASSAADVSVRVLNGSGVDGQAANVGGAIAALGFRLVAVGNGSEVGLARVPQTEVLYASGDEAAAELVASHITGGAPTVQSSLVSSGAVALVVGPDFTTVAVNPIASDSTGSSSPSSSSTSPSTAGGSSSAGTTVTTIPGYRTPAMAEAARVPPENPPPGVSCG